MNTKEKKSIRKILAILFVVVIFATIPVSTAFASGDARASTTTTKQTTVSGCEDDKHSMPTGNIGKWFNSRSEVDAYFSSTCTQMWNKYQSGAITRDEYIKNCPQGYKAWSCSKCGMWTGDFTYGEVPTEPSTSHTHTWDNGVVTKPATCTEKGVKTYTCSGCGETRTEAIAETGHKYVATVIKPTCTTSGKTVYKCENCNSSYNADYIEATGHDYKYVANNDGTHKKVCNICSDTVIESCSKVKHDNAFICSYCKAVYDDATVTEPSTDPVTKPNPTEPSTEPTTSPNESTTNKEHTDITTTVKDENKTTTEGENSTADSINKNTDKKSPNTGAEIIDTGDNAPMNIVILCASAVLIVMAVVLMLKAKQNNKSGKFEP